MCKTLQKRISIILEVTQYVALGPDCSAVSQLLAKFSQIIALDVGKLVVFGEGTYWICLDLALVMCGLWVLLVVYLLLNLDERLKNIVCIGNLGWIAWLLLPYLGSLGFIPIVSVLLDVFLCDRAAGADASSLSFSDSILCRDCYVQCWQTTHLYYAIAATIGLFLYVPSSVFFRPVWQEFQPLLHIKTSTSHYLEQYLLQMLLIVFNKTLRRVSALIHGIIFLSLILTFFLLETRPRRFNYDRVCHWYRMSLAGVLWLGTLALLSHQVSLASHYWLLTAVLGWVALLVFGYVWMRLRYPSMLAKKKGIDTRELFRFAFQFSTNFHSVQYIERLNSRYRASPTEPRITIHIPDNM